MKKNIVITGSPRSGKSVLLKEIVRRRGNCVGFVTNEIREGEERVGFEIVTYLGEKTQLAHVNFKSDKKVSRYGVNVASLDRVIPKVAEFSGFDVLYLDEIGQMQLFSENFRELALKYLNSTNTSVSTLSRVFDDEFIERVRTRQDIILIEITEKDRDTKQKLVNQLIDKIEKAKKYLREPKRFAVGPDKTSITTDHGVRTLTRRSIRWMCNCEFFQANQTCSHSIALEELLTRQKESAK